MYWEEAVSANSSYWRTIDYEGDHDYFAIWLDAGQNYTFDVEGLHGLESWGYVGDTTLALYDWWGTQLDFNDDGGGNFNPHLPSLGSSFTPWYSYWYVLEVAAYDNYGETDTGWYRLDT